MSTPACPRRWCATWSTGRRTASSPARLRLCCAISWRTPITPELLPLGAGETLEQKTEETIGPYELHDFFLFYAVRTSSPRPRSSSWRARPSPASTTRRHSALAERLLPPFLQPAVQALVPCRTAPRSARWRCRRGAIGGCPATPARRSGWARSRPSRWWADRMKKVTRRGLARRRGEPRIPLGELPWKKNSMSSASCPCREYPASA